MSTTSFKPAPSNKFILQLRQEIDAGIRLAIDPANANLPPLALRVTTIQSPWFMQSCPVCHNKFREGDLVRQCPQCQQAYHDDPQFNLNCWQKKFSDNQQCTTGGIDPFNGLEITPCHYHWDGELPNSDDSPQSSTGSIPTESVNQLVGGLRAVWRPFGQKQIEKVPQDDPRIGRKCPWCRLRIRAGDWVIACPCGCGTYFHEDIFRHLTCWNEWNGVEGNNYCPNTGRPFEKKDDE